MESITITSDTDNSITTVAAIEVSNSADNSDLQGALCKLN